MEIKNIETGIEIVALMVKTWAENGKVDDMERMVVLRKLKELSENIASLNLKSSDQKKEMVFPDLFSQVLPAQDQLPVKKKPQPVESENKSIDISKQEDNISDLHDGGDVDKQNAAAKDTVDLKSDFEFIPDAAFDNEEVFDSLPADLDMEHIVKSDFEFVQFSDEQADDFVDESNEEENIHSEDDSASEYKSQVQNNSDVTTEENVIDEDTDSDGTQVESEQTSVFAEEKNVCDNDIKDEDVKEPMPVFGKQHKFGRSAINKLYGDDSMQHRVMRDEETIKQDGHIEKGVAVSSVQYEENKEDSEVTEEDFMVMETPHENHTDKKIVLGDVLNVGKKVVGDALGNPEISETTSYSGKVKTLRGAMGINDVFLIARDLFDGDVKACEEAMDELEQMQNIDDALLYIHDHYKWDKKREGTKLVMDILMRKLM